MNNHQFRAAFWSLLCCLCLTCVLITTAGLNLTRRGVRTSARSPSKGLITAPAREGAPSAQQTTLPANHPTDFKSESPGRAVPAFGRRTNGSNSSVANGPFPSDARPVSRDRFRSVDIQARVAPGPPALDESAVGEPRIALGPILTIPQMEDRFRTEVPPPPDEPNEDPAPVLENQLPVFTASRPVTEGGLRITGLVERALDRIQSRFDALLESYRDWRTSNPHTGHRVGNVPQIEPHMPSDHPTAEIQSVATARASHGEQSAVKALPGASEFRTSESLIAIQPTPGAPDRFSLQIHSDDLPQVIRVLAAVAGMQVQLGAGVTGTVNVELQHVTIEDALSEVVRPLGYSLIIENGTAAVVPDDGDTASEALNRPLVTKVYRPKYMGACELQELVQPLLTENVGTSTVTNPSQIAISAVPVVSGRQQFSGRPALLVQDIEEVITKIDRLIATRDVPALQSASKPRIAR